VRFSHDEVPLKFQLGVDIRVLRPSPDAVPPKQLAPSLWRREPGNLRPSAASAFENLLELFVEPLDLETSSGIEAAADSR